jgi:hypothetical protein
MNPSRITKALIRKLPEFENEKLTMTWRLRNLFSHIVVKNLDLHMLIELDSY